VLEIVDPAAALTSLQIALARQMSHDCLAPLAACVGLMLPPGVEQQADQLYTLRGSMPGDLTKTQRRLINLLSERGPLRGQQIDRAMRALVAFRRPLADPRRADLPQPAAIPKVRPKLGRTVQLACPVAKLKLPANLARGSMPGAGGHLALPDEAGPWMSPGCTPRAGQAEDLRS
jgi:hypothetical protein